MSAGNPDQKVYVYAVFSSLILCPCHVQTLDSKRKDHGSGHAIHAELRCAPYTPFLAMGQQIQSSIV